jgi:hypothetical protein
MDSPVPYSLPEVSTSTAELNVQHNGAPPIDKDSLGAESFPRSPLNSAEAKKKNVAKPKAFEFKAPSKLLLRKQQMKAKQEKSDKSACKKVQSCIDHNSQLFILC